MKPLTLIFSSNDRSKLVGYYFYDSVDILFEFFFHTFDMDEDIRVEFFLDDKNGRLDLGEIPFISSCYGDCNNCEDFEFKSCYESVFYNFLYKVGRKLEEVSKEKFLNEFILGKAVYRVV